MRAHVIKNGEIVNTIEVESLDFMPGLVAAVGGEGIGWIYENGVFNEQAAPLPTIDEMKAARTELVAAIQVTTAAGNTFDGDEDSQNRMSRAISGMDDADETMWVLANSSLTTVGKAELREALRLSGIAMTAIWMAPYQ